MIIIFVVLATQTFLDLVSFLGLAETKVYYSSKHSKIDERNVMLYFKPGE